MNQTEDFRRSLKLVSQGLENDPGPHLSEEELIAYHQGRVDERARDRTQSHLVQCHECLVVFKSVNDFFEPIREDEEQPGKSEIEREWEIFRRRVGAEKPPDAGAPSARRAGVSFRPRAAFALAAGLILALGLMGFWALRLRQENRQLVAEQSGSAERLKQLEEENRRLQEDVGAARQNYESQLAKLRQPRLNAPIFDLFPQEFIQRSGAGTELNRITLPATTKEFILILNGDGQPDYPNYDVEFVDAQRQPVWRGEGLRRDGHGNFVITLDRTFLRPGEFRLKLYGRKDSRSRQIAEYPVWFKSS
jgi:hypothetical protein